jgi:hypothetical protein
VSAPDAIAILVKNGGGFDLYAQQFAVDVVAIIDDEVIAF